MTFHLVAKLADARVALQSHLLGEAECLGCAEVCDPASATTALLTGLLF